jgi:hypothetical protein
MTTWLGEFSNAVTAGLALVRKGKLQQPALRAIASPVGGDSGGLVDLAAFHDEADVFQQADAGGRLVASGG